MRIALFGATSQICRDLVQSFAVENNHELVLYARRPDVVTQWLSRTGLVDRYATADFAMFNSHEKFDAIINFVGLGNPENAVVMGASIFDVTLKYDEMALDFVRQNPDCRYIFLSSGAAYGSGFEVPVDGTSKAVISVNHLAPQDWYGVAKLHTECRHRAMTDLSIVDVRVFNYFSHTQDMAARFLITDIFRAIRDKTVLKTSADFIVRDFIHRFDFCKLVNSILGSPATNAVLDAYSRAPIEKPTLLMAMQEEFNLKYEIVQAGASVNATGGKPHYYSLNRRAADFGYLPKYTSLECIVEEILQLLRIASN